MRKTNEKSMFASPKFLCVKHKQTMCAYHMKNCVLSVANIPHEITRDMHMTVLTVCCGVSFTDSLLASLHHRSM